MLNTNSNNMLSSFASSSGINLDMEDKVDPKKEIRNISKYLKILEDLNNNDLVKLTETELEKFNFILSEVWNQIKKLIFSLNRLSQNDDYDNMLNKYKLQLDSIIYKKDIINDELNITVNTYINYNLTKILRLYNKTTESKLLELNILLQNYNETRNNEIIDDKIKELFYKNISLYNYFFKNIYDSNESVDLFSEFNKSLNITKMLENLDTLSKGYVIRKVNEIDNSIDNKETNIVKKIIETFKHDNIIMNDVIHFIVPTNKLENNQQVYEKNKSLINLEFNNYISFNEHIIKKHSINVLMKKKKQVSDLLIKLHDEIKFKLSIINKVSNN